jgi:ATP dependent DNA ligase domain
MSQDARRVDPSVVPGARPAPSPASSNPAVRRCARSPSGGRWIHEIKFDGYRAQAHLRNGQPAVYTRAGFDWTLRFQTIADALATLPANDLILDGEAVVADSRGVADFGLLHAALAAGRQDRLLYYAFDLLYLDGSTCAQRGLPSANACYPSCWPAHPSESSTPSTWREMGSRSISGGSTVACVYACREASRVRAEETPPRPRPEAREEQARRPRRAKA